MTERTFGIIPAGLALDPKLGKNAVRVGMLMAIHADKKRQCWLATETMAQLLQIDRSAVSRALAELRTRGHVTRRRRSRPGRGLTSSVYTFVNLHARASEIPAPDGDEEDVPEETAGQEPKPSSGQIRASASLGVNFTPPAPAQDDPVVRDSHHRPPPAGADSARAAGVKSTHPAGENFTPESVLEISIDDQDDEEASCTDTARARAVLADEDQACLIYDEMADRAGLPRTNKLTKQERELLRLRLADCGGVEGWRRFVEKVEHSRLLTEKMRPAPTLSWFLDEDHFAKTARGNYDRDRDPPRRPSVLDGVAAASARRRESGGAQQTWQAAQPPSPPSPPPRPTTRGRMKAEVAIIAQYAHVREAGVQEIVDQWCAALVDDGHDQAAADERVVWELKRTPKSGSALIHLRERFAVFMQGRSWAA